jgi:hypothetical protein
VRKAITRSIKVVAFLLLGANAIAQETGEINSPCDDPLNKNPDCKRSLPAKSARHIFKFPLGGPETNAQSVEDIINSLSTTGLTSCDPSCRGIHASGAPEQDTRDRFVDTLNQESLDAAKAGKTYSPPRYVILNKAVANQTY